MKPIPGQYQAAASFAENTRYHETRSEMVPSMVLLPSEYNAVPNITSKKVFKPGRMLKRQVNVNCIAPSGTGTTHTAKVIVTGP